jgi:hypothetical protein
MRAKLLLVAILAFVLGACSRTGAPAPPPLDKHLLTGKWKSTSEAQLVAGYEFAEDGAVKVTIRGMEQPIAGRYAWSGERTLDLEYPPAAETQQAYEAAAKAYKDDVQDRIKAGKLPDRAGPSILSAVRDKWPTSEALRVALSDQPRQLTLINESGGSQTFEKAD